MNEPGVFLSDETPKPDVYHHPMKTFPADARHAGDGLPGTHARYHNVYGMQMARSTFEGLKRLRPDARPFVLTRAGYAGVQRYSAVWTGDNVANWDHLRLSVSMLLNLGVSGVPLVGSDVGGFSGNPTPELYARWLEAAALTPFLRSHSEAGSNPHEPYSFGPEFTKINRASVELRYRLLPYLYTLFREHTETGAPVMRPLWFEYPDDARTYLIEDEYLVGRDLLVAPVVTEGATKRRVSFPAGDAWVDWWTGRRYEGGRDAEVDAPLERLPLFARVGAALPTIPVIQHTGERPKVSLTLVVVPGADGETRIYQDGGDGYEAGGWPVVVSQRAGAISVNQVPTAGPNIGSPVWAQIREVELLGLPERPKGVLIDERPPAKSPDFERETGRLRIEAPPSPSYTIRLAP
jgi:alpha-glucosidase